MLAKQDKVSCLRMIDSCQFPRIKWLRKWREEEDNCVPLRGRCRYLGCRAEHTLQGTWSGGWQGWTYLHWTARSLCLFYDSNFLSSSLPHRWITRRSQNFDLQFDLQFCHSQIRWVQAVDYYHTPMIYWNKWLGFNSFDERREWSWRSWFFFRGHYEGSLSKS